MEGVIELYRGVLAIIMQDLRALRRALAVGFSCLHLKALPALRPVFDIMRAAGVYAGRLGGRALATCLGAAQNALDEVVTELHLDDLLAQVGDARRIASHWFSILTRILNDCGAHVSVFIFSAQGKSSLASIACGGTGLICIHLSSHPNWKGVRTRGIVSCLFLSGASATGAKHLELPSSLPQHVLIGGGSLIGLVTGTALLSLYRSLQRAKIPVMSAVGAMGGLSLVLNGAVILANS